MFYLAISREESVELPMWFIPSMCNLPPSDDLAKRLGRPISDLDDVRDSMGALGSIRNNEIEIDMIIGPIEVRLKIKSLQSSKILVYSGPIFCVGVCVCVCVCVSVCMCVGVCDHLFIFRNLMPC